MFQKHFSIQVPIVQVGYVIDVIVSGHQPQDQESKQLEFDQAVPGVISLQTFYSDILTLEMYIPFEKLLPKFTHNPREILSLPAIKIEEGYPAKLSILDPNKQWVFDEHSNKSKSINSPRYMQVMVGAIDGVINKDFSTY